MIEVRGLGVTFPGAASPVRARASPISLAATPHSRMPLATCRPSRHTNQSCVSQPNRTIPSTVLARPARAPDRTKTGQSYRRYRVRANAASAPAPCTRPTISKVGPTGDARNTTSTRAAASSTTMPTPGLRTM